MSTGELWKHGVRMRLAEQPFQILALLLETPGSLVTRERMREELWPADTYVEFDRSLNSAVRRLRTALGDSSRRPRYIETLPKRGYRFVAEVEAVNDLRSEPLDGELESTGAGTPAPRSEIPSLSPALRPLLRRAAVLTLLTTALVVAVMLRDSRSPSAEAGPRRLVAQPLEGFPDNAHDPALSPDGRTLAYAAAIEEDNRDIHIQRINGGEPVRLTTDAGSDIAPSWAPDGARLAYTSRWPAPAPGSYVLSLADGGRVRVGPAARGRVDWTPEGEALVGINLGPSGGFALLPLATREEQPFDEETLESYDTDAALSPDGKTVAFGRCTHPSSCDVWVRPLDGGEPRRLTFQYGRLEGLGWVPDTDEIVYAIERRLYRVRASGGSPPVRLEFDSNDLIYGKSSMPTLARLAPNGPIRLVFQHRLVDTDIWITDVSEGATESLSVRRRKLIDSPGVDRRARFSPDGRRIAFLSDRTGAPALWVADSDGGRQRQVTPVDLRVRDDSPPAWSPDGRTLAFRASTLAAPQNHIYTIPAEGGDFQAITMGKGEQNPLWSRDGRWVYHVSRGSGLPEIRMARFDGSSPPIPITEGGGAAGLALSPDGQWLYFNENDPGAPGRSLMRIPAKGGESERVRNPFSYSTIQFIGDEIYYLPLPDARMLGSKTVVSLARFDPSGGPDTEVARIANPSGPRHFSLSPDGSSLLTDHLERFEFRLMLVEDFR